MPVLVSMECGWQVARRGSRRAAFRDGWPVALTAFRVAPVVNPESSGLNRTSCTSRPRVVAASTATQEAGSARELFLLSQAGSFSPFNMQNNSCANVYSLLFLSRNERQGSRAISDRLCNLASGPAI
jgi:hypothetical protein